MTLLPVTLSTAAACIVLNMWLGMRVSSLRYTLKVSVGDGGQEPLLRRMRAQANFIENAPFVLILLGGLELSGASRLGLALIAAIFLLARIAHAIGMDGGSVGVWRRNGILTSSFVSLALAFWAIAQVATAYLGR
jgi:uncharacterized protein